MSHESSRLEFLGQLAGGLAHEVKNPLSTMRLHLELMEEDLQGDKSERGRRMLNKTQILLKEIRRLEEIVHEFLKVSRGHDLKLTTVDAARMLEELVEFVRPEAQAANVSLNLRIQNPLGNLLLDENYFRQALLNLIQNAIEACKPKGGGDVIIEVGRGRDAIGIAIIDTGVGIPEGVRARIFRAYFTTRKGGTGMGLPMARRIVEEHGGHVAFDSVEGQGSRFMIMLPATAGESLSQLVLHESSGRAAGTGEGAPIDVSAVVNAALAQAREGGGKAQKKKREK